MLENQKKENKMKQMKVHVWYSPTRRRKKEATKYGAWGIIVFSAHLARNIWFWGFMGKTYLTEIQFLCKSNSLSGLFSRKIYLNLEICLSNGALTITKILHFITPTWICLICFRKLTNNKLIMIDRYLIYRLKWISKQWLKKLNYPKPKIYTCTNWYQWIHSGKKNW